jgi:hypothetical protein
MEIDPSQPFQASRGDCAAGEVVLPADVAPTVAPQGHPSLRERRPATWHPEA